MLRTINAGLLLMGCLMLLSACITEVTRGKVVPETDPKEALSSHIQLGLNYLGKGDRETSRFHLEKALKIDSRSAGALHAMALLHKVEGETALAEKYFKQAVREDSDFSMAHNNFGLFLFQQGRYKEAFREYRKAAGDVSYENRTSALTSAGICARLLDQDKKAESFFQHALTLNPGFPMALLEMAELEFDRKNFNEAKGFHDRFSNSRRQTPKSLWLGIRLERIFGDKDREASYVMALKNLHQSSSEYREYMKSEKLNTDS